MSGEVTKKTTSSEITDTVKVSVTQVEKTPITQIRDFIGSWKFKTFLLLLGIFTVGVIYFLSSLTHQMAVKGMKMWASHAKATPVDCVFRDTNNDGYISCTAMVKDQVLPLECGTSPFNVGCRVNYGGVSSIVSQTKQ